MEGSTLLCVPVVGKTVEQMAAAKAAGADPVVIRLDHISAFRPREDLEFLLKGRCLLSSPTDCTKKTALVGWQGCWSG